MKYLMLIIILLCGCSPYQTAVMNDYFDRQREQANFESAQRTRIIEVGLYSSSNNTFKPIQSTQTRTTCHKQFNGDVVCDTY